MNYYFSFQEKRNNDKREAFNIYGNTSRMYGSILSIFVGKAMYFGIYGNERDGVNFNTLTKKQLQEWFGPEETENIQSFKKKLLRKTETSLKKNIKSHLIVMKSHLKNISYGGIIFFILK